MWVRVETAVAVGLMIVMLGAAALQVAVRFALSAYVDIPWTEELSRLTLVWVTFWGAMILHRTDDHIAMPIFYNLLPAPAKEAVGIFGDLVVLVSMGLTTWYGWLAAEQMLAQQTITLSIPWLGAPVPVAAFAYAMPVGGTLVSGWTLYRVGRRLRGGAVTSGPRTEI
jgi:TRAP-type C4-dicarboxylate transport system permease small subunit